MPLVDVFRVFEGDRLKQVGLSMEQVRRLCPEATSPGWVIKREEMLLPEADGEVLDWGSGLLHVHWQCPFCKQEHISDFLPHADSNPVVWFCERSRTHEMCLVHWRHKGAEPAAEGLTVPEHMA